MVCGRRLDGEFLGAGRAGGKKSDSPWGVDVK